jgi:glutamate-1-semialdehyde aminotransferase
MTAARAWRESARLLARARERIPGAHHLSSRPLLADGGGPIYFTRGAGARIWDVDGNEYVDFFMGFGPFLLGYAHPEVDAAAVEQLRGGSLLSMSHPMHVRFVEALVDWFPGAEMGLFFKTGSEATTAALRIARRATGRRIVVRAGYHGWHDWCLPREPYVPAALDEQVLEFTPDDPTSLDRIFTECSRAIAAVIVAPEMLRSLTPARLAALQARTARAGAVFILDEVKTAFRTQPGSVQQRFGLTPDLTTVSKALGNGWPIAGVVGKRAVMEAAADLHVSATFHGDTAPMAAALAVMRIIRREHADETAWRLGARLIDGLLRIARAHGVDAQAYGEPLPPMPFFRIADDRRRERFYGEMLARGFLLHPRHMWFVSAAHTDEDVTRLLDAADESMKHAVAE